MIRRPPRSTLDRSSAASDVYKRQHLHGVINCQAGIDAAAGAVDVHVDGLVRVVAVQVEQLRHDEVGNLVVDCLLYTSPSPRDRTRSRMPSSA